MTGDAAAAGAVVFTDIVGFSEFTAERGDDEALRVLEHQDRIVTEILGDGGRVVKALGDGLLLWFDDASLGLVTCLELQGRFAAEASAERPLWVRIGAHWGAPRRRGEDVVGHDVNLAARIVELAAPGEVLASAALVERAPHGLACEQLGPVVMRGIPDPVRLYRVRSARDAAGVRSPGSAAPRR